MHNDGSIDKWSEETANEVANEFYVRTAITFPCTGIVVSQCMFVLFVVLEVGHGSLTDVAFSARCGLCDRAYVYER